MKSSSAAPERILAYGLYGSGKTHSWATIAQWMRRTETSGRFLVISCEHNTVDRLRDGYPKTESDPGFDTNVSYRDVHNWSELTEWTDLILGSADADAWIVVEGIDKPWHWVQQLWHESRGTIDGDPSDPFAMKKTPVNEKTGQPEVDWTRVNAVYRNWIVPILTSKAHVFACAPQDNVTVPTGKKGEWADSQQIVEQFARFGYKPAGQKDLGFQFHTVLLMSNKRAGDYRVQTVDDHTRTKLEDAQVNDFVMDYLVNIAHWEL